MAARDWLERRAGGPARLYDAVVGRLDASGLAAARQSLVGDVAGPVLELGCGTGSAFSRYPAGVEVTAVEPEPGFRRAAEARAATVAARVRVVPGDAHDLPFDDASFDTVVAQLMMCSVAAPRAVLSEVRRVLRPGGDLRLLEHVRHRSRPVARLQDAIDPLWSAIEGRGCRLGRDTPTLVAEAGFVLQRVDTVPLPAAVEWLFPIVLVRARRP